MKEFRDCCTQNFVQVNMFAGICEPFFASDHVCDFHFPIINYIGEMECRPTVFFYDYKIIEFNKGDCAIILVGKYRRDLKKIGPDSDCIRLTFENSLFDLLKSQSGAFAIVWSWRGFSLLIFLIVFRGFEFLFFLCVAVGLGFSLMRAKAGVSKIIFEQHFFDVFVEW